MYKLNNRLNKTGLAVLLAASLGAGSALAQDADPAAPAAPEAPAANPVDPAKPTDPGTTQGDQAELIGQPVFSADGKKVGDVARVVKNDAGEVTEIEVASGGILGIGGKVAKFPADKMQTQDNQVMLSLSAEEAEAMFQ